jgi:predicted dehydrogenase
MAFKYGLVGIGNISGVHFKAIEKLGGEVIAVSDIRYERAQKKAEEIGCQAYQDYHQMVEQEGLDIVVVLTPHYFHPDISKAALQNGCHVLCEKPISVSKGESHELLKVANESDRIMGVNCMLRFRPDIQAIKEILESDVLGTLRAAHFVSNNWLRSTAYYDEGEWRGTWEEEGGGLLTNQSPHDLDKIIHFFGSPYIVKAFAGTSSFHPNLAVEDYADALLLYDNNFRVYFSAATHLHPGVERLEIWGEKGYCRLENNSIKKGLLQQPLCEWNEQNADMWGTPDVEWSQKWYDIPGFDELHKMSHQNLIQAIEGKEAIKTNAREAIKSVELANAIILSAYRDKNITLPIDETEYCEFLREMVELERVKFSQKDKQ